jgi:RHS repeat-associated protein
MGRPVSTTAYNPVTYQWDTVATAAYGTAGQVTSLWTIWAGTETRTYNSLLQLTRATVPGLMDNLSERSRMQYIYTAGQNNGRIAESIDGISGEDVLYTYDSLQRLVLAQTTSSGPQWGDAYTYDGFGNLTAKTPTKGSAPVLAAVYDPVTNWPVGGNYDANGNAPGPGGTPTWSVENRLLSQTLDGVALTWGYDGSGQRIMQYQTVNGQPQWTFYLYGIQGRRMAQFVCAPSGTYPYNTVCTAAGAHVYFAGKLIAATDATGRLLGVTDRQGSVRAAETNGTWATSSYYPYGEEKQPLAPDGMEKFGTYVRDSSLSGQDYARQRYYSPNLGRFNSPDPGGAGTRLRSPLSWNRYSYVQGDPVNRTDPSGLDGSGYHICSIWDPEVWDGQKMPGDDGCEDNGGEDGDDGDDGGMCAVVEASFGESGLGCIAVIVAVPVASSQSEPDCDPGWLADDTSVTAFNGKTYTGADIDFAARILFAEASQDQAERDAVASVELNRTNTRGFGGSTFYATRNGYQAYTSNTSAFQSTDIASGAYTKLDTLDCQSLKNAIGTIDRIVTSGPVDNYLYFRAGTQGYGTVIGSQRFWRTPPKPPKKRRKPRPDF